MFIIAIPGHHTCGDTVDVTINGKPAKLTWQDARTLVINGHDRRTMIDQDMIVDGKGQRCHSFICGDGTETIIKALDPTDKEETK
jgi:hypothetical protein